MKMTSISLALLLTLSAGSAHAQGEGSKGGGGGDLEAFSVGTMWFPNEDGAHPTIRYCMEISAQFGVPEAEIQGDLEASYRTWVDYYRKRLVSVSDPKVTIPTQLEKLSRCDGSEDLKFYLGGTNDEVALAKKKYSNPYALAERTETDPAKGRQGFVWVADPGTVEAYFPLWSQVKYQLRAVLSHEWGHVLGCGHVRGTIMRKDLHETLVDHGGVRRIPDPKWARRKGIDHERELARETLDHVRMQSTIQHWFPAETEAEMIRAWTGSTIATADRKIELEIIRMPDEKDFFGIASLMRLDVRIKIQTAAGVSIRSIRNLATSGLMEDGVSVFKAPGRNRNPYATLYTGYVQREGGKKIAVEIEYNMQGSYSSSGMRPWVLYVTYDGERRALASFAEKIGSSGL